VRPTATIVVADTALKVGETSLVTITFSEAVTGFTNADLTIANGTLSAVSSRRRHHLDGDLHADRSITDTTNLITLDNTGVTDLRATPAAAPPTRTTTPSTPSARPRPSWWPTRTCGRRNLAGDHHLQRSGDRFHQRRPDRRQRHPERVSSSDGGITWTATFTPNASITDTTNLITLDNTGVTDLRATPAAAPPTPTTTPSTRAPTATIVVADTALKIGETRW
jgi:hypothetical protein